MSDMKQNKQKQNQWLKGSFVGSAGLLMIKLISLFYIVPFTAMAGNSGTVMYAAVKDVSAVFLEIACAGIPYILFFMINEREGKDVRTKLLIRRISLQVTAGTAVVAAGCLLLASPWFASWILTAQASAEEVASLQNLFAVSSLFVFLSPFVYDMIGYLKGLKEESKIKHATYLEWIIRYSVLFLVGIGMLKVTKSSINPMPLTAILACIAGICAALIYLVKKEQKKYSEMIAEARCQQTPAENISSIKKEIKELVLVFILSAFFGNSQHLMHAFFFLPAVDQLNISYEQSVNLFGILELNCSLFTEGLQIASLILFNLFHEKLEETFYQKDMDGFCVILERWLNVFLYDLLPVSFSILVLAKPLYYIFFGSTLLEESSILLSWSSILGILQALSLVCWIILIRLQKYKEAVSYLITGFLIKAVSFSPLIQYMGTSGAVVSSILCSAVIIFLSLSKLSNLTDMSYGHVFFNLIRILTACLAMNGVYILFRTYVLDPMSADRGMALLITAVMLTCGYAGYRFVTSVIGVRKDILRQQNAKMEDTL
jgi:O-antigen/teichoic acid export membrane protein